MPDPWLASIGLNCIAASMLRHFSDRISKRDSQLLDYRCAEIICAQLCDRGKIVVKYLAPLALGVIASLPKKDRHQLAPR